MPSRDEVQEARDTATEIEQIYDDFMLQHADLGKTARSLVTAKHYIEELVEALKAKNELLICYRVGRQPSEALFRRLERAKGVLAKWSDDDA